MPGGEGISVLSTNSGGPEYGKGREGREVKSQNPGGYSRDLVESRSRVMEEGNKHIKRFDYFAGGLCEEGRTDCTNICLHKLSAKKKNICLCIN